MAKLLTACLAALVALSVCAPTVGASPTLAIVAPANGAAIQGSSVAVTFKTSDIKIAPATVALEEAGKRPEVNRADECHLYLTLDLWPMVVWDRAETYTFNNVPAGEHLLTVELVNNDHAPFSPPIVQTIRFTSSAAPSAPTQMPSTGAGDHTALWPFVLLALALLANGISLRRRVR